MFPAASAGAPATIVLPAGGLIVRVHHVSRGGVFFGPSPGSRPGNRFDAPNGEYRVMYASERLEGAFVETILRRPRGRILRRAFVDERAWSVIRLERRIVLAKVFDEGLQAFGVDAGEIGADDYTVSRDLALRIHEGSSAIQGIAYRSRYNNGEICYALFDRVSAVDLTPVRSERFSARADTVSRLMVLHRASFDDSAEVPEVLPPD